MSPTNQKPYSRNFDFIARFVDALRSKKFSARTLRDGKCDAMALCHASPLNNQSQPKG
jgi:hypothetical protein